MEKAMHTSCRNTLLFLLLACPALSWATLGGSIDQVPGDRVQLRAKAAAGKGAQDYTMHMRQTAAGITVREYADAAGTVFAVSWEGPVKPDLGQLLGPYFNDFRTQAESGRMGRRRLVVDKPGLVILSEGRLRAFTGKAYLPKALPAGVTIDELQ
jgi:hypothetical protein